MSERKQTEAEVYADIPPRELVEALTAGTFAATGVRNPVELTHGLPESIERHGITFVRLGEANP